MIKKLHFGVQKTVALKSGPERSLGRIWGLLGPQEGPKGEKTRKSDFEDPPPGTQLGTKMCTFLGFGALLADFARYFVQAPLLRVFLAFFCRFVASPESKKSLNSCNSHQKSRFRGF